MYMACYTDEFEGVNFCTFFFLIKNQIPNLLCHSYKTLVDMNVMKRNFTWDEKVKDLILDEKEESKNSIFQLCPVFHLMHYNLMTKLIDLLQILRCLCLL